ncbi:MAG: response regulator [Nitrosomonadales bacterium]
MAKLAEVDAEVVLVDIRMPQMDGIELALHLNKLLKPPVIIFTTAYDDYAIRAFELHAIDYLLKPIRLRRLFDALSRARNAVPVRTEDLRELTPRTAQIFVYPRNGEKFISSRFRTCFICVPN